MPFVRIDNRLVHGQIIESWLPFTGARGIVVANDELSADFLRQEIMSLAIPAGIRIAFVPVEGLLPLMARSPLEAEDVLILFSNCHDARLAYERGFGFTVLNLGNLHYAPGKKQVCPHVALSRDDESCLDYLRDQGVRLDYRCVPSDSSQPRSV